jgi:predicted RNA-binding protein with PIN domain
MRWLVDASNVIGSVPDGWWKDRVGAARRLIEQLEAFADETGDPVTVVLDAGPPELASRDKGVAVVLARRRGRDAADDEIVRLLEAQEAPEEVTVATSDANLSDRVRALGAAVEGAKTFRRRLE